MLHASQSDIQVKERSPLALAFVGDGVLELLVRGRLVALGRHSPGALHREATRLVSAKGQYALLQGLSPHLSEAELDIVRRGRNASKATVSKHATPEEYRASTGLEALFGWLYLQKEEQRIEELFEILWAFYEANIKQVT